jgi:hypothetical protein
MRRRMPMILALGAAVLVVAGCGASSGGKSSAKKFSGEQRAVATTVEDLESAGSKRKPGEICDHLLSKSLVDAITKASGKSCSSAVDRTMKDVDAYDLVVLDNGVTITGTKATAKVQSKAGDEEDVSTLQLVKEDGRWKISAIGVAQNIKN